MLMEMFTYIVTDKHEVQNPANEKKGYFFSSTNAYLYIYYLQHIILQYKTHHHINILNYFMSPP
jgi:hypothetical protein